MMVVNLLVHQPNASVLKNIVKKLSMIHMIYLTPVSTAVHLRFDTDSWLAAYVESANTFGAIHFMCRYR